MSALSMLLGGGVSDIGFGLMPPAEANARNGDSVALSDTSTTTPLVVAIGAPGYLDGAVHIYSFDGTKYNFFTTILSPAPNIDFGFSVALNGDGTVLAIGAPDDQGEGRVHMYLWDGTIHVPDQILDAGGLGPFAGGRTGEIVRLSKSGESVMASSPIAGPSDRGWAYSWFKSGTWIFVVQRIGELSPSVPNGACSESMDMDSGGLTVILMQPGNAYIRIFERVNTSDIFVEVFTQQVATIGGLAGVAIEDSSQLAFLTDPPAGASTGGIRSIINNGGGSWSSASFLAAPVTAGPSWGTAIVARNLDMFIGENSANLVHAYTYTGGGVMTFVGSNGAPDNGNGQQFGHALALAFPGAVRRLIVGEPNRFRLGLVGAGNAYVEP